MTKVNSLIFLFLTVFFGNALQVNGQSAYEKTLQHDRDSIDVVFGDAEQSILTAEDVANFHGLAYYPIDISYRVPCSFKRLKNQKPFQMKTSTDRLPTYVAYGKLSFKVNGEQCELTVYQNLDLIKNKEYADYLFIPFIDETSGNETYGAGRYMDIRIGDLEDNPVIDFNTCYNPYCAYNNRYSCPVPPSENHLTVPIHAGVKYTPH